MTADRLSDAGVRCQLLWKLCRRHGWSTPIPKDDLVRMALEDTEQGRGKTLVEELIEEPYIGYREGKGYAVGNDRDTQAIAAFRLRDTCTYSELRIEATLSRFKQAGGFDEYDQSVTVGLDRW